MSRDPVEFLVLLGLLAAGGLIGVVGHAVTRHFLGVVVCTGLLVSGAIQLYLRTRGYDWSMDRFALIGLLYPAAASSFAAAIVGIPFALRRRSPSLPAQPPNESPTRQQMK